MSEFVLPAGFERVEPPRAPAGLPPGFEPVEIGEFETLKGPEALKALREMGPGAELTFLDGKHDRLEDLDFDEWKRREELIKELGFWDRHVERNADAVRGALSGLWSTVRGAASEIGGVIADTLIDRTISPVEALRRTNATGAEAAVIGAYDFTDLVSGAARTLTGGMDMYGRDDTPEERQKVDYEHYLERQGARRERAQLARDSMIGSAVGGAVELATGDERAAIAAQQSIAADRLPNTSEAAGMFSPSNPLNLLPVGAGGKAATAGALASRGAAVTAEKTALAANWLRAATDIGRGVELAARKVVPGISDETARVLRKSATASAWTAATGAGAVGLGTDSDNLTTLGAAFAGMRAGLATVGKTSEFLGGVARHAAQGPRLQSTLARVARDSAVPEWAASTAKILESAGTTQAVRTAKAAAGGAATGAGVNTVLGILGGADEQEIVGSATTGAVVGGVLGAAGRAATDDAALRQNAERLFMAEAQRERNGDTAAALFYGLPESEQLALGTIQAIAGPAIPIDVVDAATFNSRTGSTGAGIFIDEPRAGQVGSIVINGEAKRPAGVTALHEFSHALAARQHPSEIRAYVDSLATPEELAAFEADYLKNVVREKRARGEYADRPTSQQFDELGFPVKNDAGRDTTDIARAREEMVATNGPDWLHQEFFAEKGAEALGKVNLPKVAQTGQWEPEAARSLRVKQGVLRNAGVAFNADGSVIEPEFMGKALSAQGEEALGRLLSGYVKEAAEYAPRLDAEVKKVAAADVGKGPAINFGKDNAGVVTHPAFKAGFVDTAGGGKESEFARVSPDGKVELKSPKEVATAEARREAELQRLFPRTGPKLERSDALVGRRATDTGGEEISGTVLPKGFYESDAFPNPQRERARMLETLMNAPGGESAEHWYHQIGSGSSGTWAAAVRKRLGNVRATFREVRPLSFLVTKAGNLGVRVIDLQALNAKALDLAHNGKLELWAGNLDRFHEDLKALMANWSQGLPGETGIGQTKKDFFVGTDAAPGGFLGKDDTKGSLIKTFRLDRMEDVRPTGRSGFTFDYGKFKSRMSPDVPEGPRAFEMASPNVLEGTVFDQAEAAIPTERHADFVRYAESVNKALGLQSRTSSVVGAWADGAENSTVTAIRNAPDYETVRLASALKGAYGQQKAVIPFFESQDGGSLMVTFEMPQDLREAHKLLLAGDIPFHSLEPSGSGTKVYVFDESGTMGNTLDGFLENHGIDDAQITRGHGEFLGSWTSREEGLAAYRSILDRVQLQTIQGRDPSGSGVDLARLVREAIKSGEEGVEAERKAK